MPIGAQNIGTAYVRVIADGEDFDLGDMLRGHEGDGEMAGRRLSKAYEEGFREEWSKKPNQTRLRKAIYDALVPADAAKMFTATRNFQNFKGSLVTEYGDIGKRAGENFERELNTGRMDMTQFNRNISDLNKYLVQAEKELNEERKQEAQNLAQYYRDFNAAILEDDRRTHTARMAMLGEAYRMNQQYDRQRARQMRDVIVGNNELIRTYRQLRGDIELMTKGEIEHGLSVSDVASRLKTLTAELRNSSVWNRQVEADVNRHHDALLRMNPTLNRYRNDLFKIGDATGAAFGRGSRNDFLNFTGSVARNVIRLGGSILDLVGYFNGLRNRMADAGSVGGAFKVVLSDIGGFAARAVGGLAGLFGVIGPLTSLLSGLGGMILAVASSMGGALLGAVSSLGSTLSFGLAGAVAIGATAFVPLIAGIGTFALAVANADEDTKASLASIKDSFSGLGEVAADSTFANIDEQARRFKGVLTDFTPLIDGVGSALSRVGDSWLDMMEGPGFAQFQSALTQFLPGAVENLGIAIGNVAGGFAGLFRAVIPEAQTFLGWLQRITGDFNRFANSASGQTELRTFFSRAAEAAADLGGFVMALTGLVAELFDQANQPGDRLFASMTEGLKDWTAELDANPDIMQGWIESMENFGKFAGSARDLLLELLAAGQDVGDSLFASMSETIDGWVTTLRANPDILSSWYDSAGNFARALGDVTVGLGKVFSALDNTFSRGAITGAFEAIAGAIDIIAGSLETIAGLFGSGGDAALTFAGQIAGATFALGVFTKALPVAGITGFIGNIRSAETRMTSLAGAIKPLLTAGGVLALGDALQDAGDKGSTFGSILQGAAGGAGIGAMFGPMGALIGAGAGAGLTALRGAFADTGDAAQKSSAQIAQARGMAIAKEDADSLREALVGVKNAYGETSRAAVEASFTGEDGKLDADIARLRDLGVSMDTIVSASLGQADAQARVNAALSGGATNAEQFAADAKAAYEEARDGVITYRDAQGQLVTQRYPTERIEELKKAWEDAESAVDKNSQATDAFNARIRENGNAIADNRAKIRGLADDLGIAVKQYKDFPDEVRTRFEAAGLPQTITDAKRLIADYKDLQNYKSIKAIISAPGVDATAEDIRKLARQYDLTPKQIRTLIRQEGSESAKRAIDDVTNAAKNLNKQTPKPKIDVDKSAADSKMGDVRRDLEFIGRVTKTPKIDVDNSGAMGTIATTKSALNSIPDETVFVNVVRRQTASNFGPQPGPTASGGTFFGPEVRLIGEAGPEAVVPLARNLTMVDPSVRWLSAIAQGKSAPGTTISGPSKTVSADGWTIVTSTQDTEGVANEIINRLVGVGY